MTINLAVTFTLFMGGSKNFSVSGAGSLLSRQQTKLEKAQFKL
jgi:hypothetical protein